MGAGRAGSDDCRRLLCPAAAAAVRLLIRPINSANVPPPLPLKRLSTKASRKREEELGIILRSPAPVSPFRGAIFKIARSFFCEGSDRGIVEGESQG